MLTLSECLQWTQGKLLQVKISHLSFKGLGSDTRKDLTDQIFVALVGESHDAHDFLGQAIKKNAAAILVHRLPVNFHAPNIPVILVKDTLEALQSLAHQYRKTLKAKVIGITGSNGKTSTKEFTAALLTPYLKTHWNEGSFNNHWGVPFNLLGVPQDTEAALVEMGMNHAGEIQRLVEIAEPDIVVCTMVGKAHIEHFTSIEKIAEAKAEIYKHSPNARKIFSLDQDLTRKMRERYSQGSGDLTFSETDEGADVCLKIDEVHFESLKISGHIAGLRGEAVVPIFGKQNLTNLMAASTIALAAGLRSEQIWTALPRCKTAWGRNQLLKLRSGANLIFDAYNANPDSMNALLQNLRSMVGQKIIGVFGQMKELGAISAEAHEDFGKTAGKISFERVYFIGDDHTAFAKGMSSSGFRGGLLTAQDMTTEMQQDFASHIAADHLVVMKASRGTKLERFLDDSVIDLQIFKK